MEDDVMLNVFNVYKGGCNIFSSCRILGRWFIEFYSGLWKEFDLLIYWGVLILWLYREVVNCWFVVGKNI